MIAAADVAASADLKSFMPETFGGQAAGNKIAKMMPNDNYGTSQIGDFVDDRVYVRSNIC